VKDEHPYLARKNINANGARLSKGSLILPVRYNDKICSLQFITADGSKRFLRNGRVSVGYFIIGSIKGANSLCITEGFATGATIYQETKEAVAVCFNAGNLKPVALILKKKHPDINIIIAADNDHWKKENVGLTKGREAAAVINATMIYPDFEEFGNPEGMSDFNDYVALGGVM